MASSYYSPGVQSRTVGSTESTTVRFDESMTVGLNLEQDSGFRGRQGFSLRLLGLPVIMV